LSAGNASLWLIKEDKESIGAVDKSGFLEGLAVAYAYLVTTCISHLHSLLRVYPMDFIVLDVKSTAIEPRMRITLANIYDILLNVGCNDKK
jgi:hypothetical protein